jgi:hypothetical protein
MPDTASDVTNITVPSTGRLAIRTVSVRISVPTGQHVQAQLFYTGRDGKAVSLVVPLVPQGDFAGDDIVLQLLDVDLYPKAGTNVGLHVYRYPAGGASNVQVSFQLLGELT